jgi:hypothetical protein
MTATADTVRRENRGPVLKTDKALLVADDRIIGVSFYLGTSAKH